MRVLVTGASGFIGRNLVETLGRDAEVLAPGHRELDLRDEQAVDRWMDAHRPDAVVHCATKPGHRNAADPTGLVDANTRMFLNLTRRPVERLVLLTSGAVYDQRFYAPKMPEERFGAHVPVDETGYSKYVCARLAERMENVVELRPFGVFGPHEDWEIRFISNALCKAICGLPITLRQDRRFDYVWVHDLVEVIRRVLRGGAPAGAYNVTPDAAIGLAALAEKVRAVAGRDVEIRIAQPGQGVEYSGDNARLRRDFPDLVLTPVDDAIRRLHAWYVEHRDAIDPALLLHDK